jgi:hypothetical protein
MEKIQINTVPVTIRVMEVGGKRMTLSVFNQIRNGDFFDDDTISEAERKEAFLGWVSYKGDKYVIFAISGCLKKDKYTHQYVDASIRRALSDSKDRLKHYVVIYGEENSLTKSESARVERLTKEVKDDIDFVDSYNKKYMELCTDESQIFISI